MSDPTSKSLLARIEALEKENTELQQDCANLAEQMRALNRVDVENDDLRELLQWCLKTWFAGKIASMQEYQTKMARIDELLWSSERADKSEER